MKRNLNKGIKLIYTGFVSLKKVAPCTEVLRLWCRVAWSFLFPETLKTECALAFLLTYNMLNIQSALYNEETISSLLFHVYCLVFLCKWPLELSAYIDGTKPKRFNSLNRYCG